MRLITVLVLDSSSDLLDNEISGSCSEALFIKMFYVYLLEKKEKDWHYVGFTSNLRKRIREHFSGQVTSTKSYIPLTLIFYEAYSSEEDARRREKYLKTTPGKQALRRMLRSHFAEKTSSIKQGSTT